MLSDLKGFFSRFFSFSKKRTLTTAGLPFPELLAEQFHVHLRNDPGVLNQHVRSVSGPDYAGFGTLLQKKWLDPTDSGAEIHTCTNTDLCVCL